MASTFLLLLGLEISLILFLDKKISDFLFYLYNKSKIFANLINIGNTLGAPSLYTKLMIFIFFLLAFIYIFGKVKKMKTKYKYILGGILASFLLSNVVVHTLKISILRKRPYITNNTLEFFCYEEAIKTNKLFKTDYKSFPSGHTICAACVYFFLFFLLKNSKNNTLKIFSYILFFIPFLTAISRIAVKAHWPSDTIFSLILGYFISKYIYKKIYIKLNTEEENEISFN